MEKKTKAGDTNLTMRVRTSDLLVLREAMLFYRKFLKRRLKEYEESEQEFHIVDDLISSSSYLLDRIEKRYNLDVSQVDQFDKEYYRRVRKLYMKVR